MPIFLRNEIWTLSLLPDFGACFTSCECMGFPVMRPGDIDQIVSGDVFASSCFPMMPYSNRIKNGQFSFRGKTVKIDSNHPKHVFPIHGHVWDKPWRVENLTENSCDLSLTYEPESGQWPWAFEARQKIMIKDTNLTVQMSIQNIDDAPFPAGLGLHPFFADAPTAQVRFLARDIWVCDDELIPTERMRLREDIDFSSIKKTHGLTLDNCFDGWNGQAEISWPGLDGTISMDTDPKLSQLVVYIDRKNEFFCLEPVSHVNNAVNMGPTHAMSVLESGATLESTITFSFLPAGR